MAIASTGFAVLRSPRNIGRDALFEVLQTSAVTLQLRQRSSGGAYPAITIPQLERVLVPLLDESEATALLAQLDAARAERDAGLAAAEASLAGLDGFILGELGLALAPPDGPTGPFAIR